jgi:hypothetical protein
MYSPGLEGLPETRVAPAHFPEGLFDVFGGQDKILSDNVITSIAQPPKHIVGRHNGPVYRQKKAVWPIIFLPVAGP